MRFSIDPKPIGAFVEYTLKPLIEDSRDLLDLLEKHNLKVGDVIERAFRIYVFDAIIRLVINLSVVGMICYTVLRCLNTTR